MHHGCIHSLSGTTICSLLLVEKDNLSDNLKILEQDSSSRLLSARGKKSLLLYGWMQIPVDEEMPAASCDWAESKDCRKETEIEEVKWAGVLKTEEAAALPYGGTCEYCTFIKITIKYIFIYLNIFFKSTFKTKTAKLFYTLFLTYNVVTAKLVILYLTKWYVCLCCMYEREEQEPENQF